MTKKIIRQTGDMTREKIIQAAKRLFAKNGFSGTSVEEIATAAKINQSLIFHHFKNKSNLWKIVKQSFLEKNSERILDEDLNLKQFLNEIIFSRYLFYKQDPDIIRIILWQKMEPKREQLAGANKQSPQNWLPEIRRRQLNGTITNNIKPEYIMTMIIGVLDSILFPGGRHFTLTEEREYLESCVESFYKILNNS